MGEKVTPTPPPPLPDDPNIARLSAKASADQVAALQTQAQGDTASIMARYGARLALAGTGGTPAVTATALPTPSAAPATPDIGKFALSLTALGR